VAADQVQATKINSKCVDLTCDEIALESTCTQITAADPNAACGGSCSSAKGCGSSQRSRRSGASDLEFVVIQPIGSSTKTLQNLQNGIPLMKKSNSSPVFIPVTSSSSKIIALPLLSGAGGIYTLSSINEAPAIVKPWRSRRGCCRAQNSKGKNKRNVVKFVLPSESYRADKKACMQACVQDYGCVAFEVKRDVLVANHELETVENDGHWWSNVKRTTQNQCELFFAPAVYKSTSKRTNNCQNTICGSPDFGKKGKWLGKY
jgi:hypothetical protein